MKKPNAQKQTPLPAGSANHWPAIISGAVLATMLLCFAAHFLKDPECVKCGHTFSANTGKAVKVYTVDRKEMAMRFCQEHAPAWDVAHSRYSTEGGVVHSLFNDWHGTTFWKKQSGEREVRLDGSELDPHRCAPCPREHAPEKPLTNIIMGNIFFTNTHRWIHYE